MTKLLLVQFIFMSLKNMWLFSLSDVAVVAKLINIVFQFVFAAGLSWGKSSMYVRCCDKCDARCTVTHEESQFSVLKT